MIVYVDASAMANGETGLERVGRYVSTDDGATWTNAGAATILGAEKQIPVDPNLIQLPDGTLRLYYLDFSTAKPAGTGTKDYVFFAADSKDGETFSGVQEVYRGTNITDPEVAVVDGRYVLYHAKPFEDDMRAAISDDGLTFVEMSLSGSFDGIPGSLVVDEKVRLFGCAKGSIVWYESEDGKTFGTAHEAFARGSGIVLCDPDPVELSDGSYLLAVKKMPTISPSKP